MPRTPTIADRIKAEIAAERARALGPLRRATDARDAEEERILIEAASNLLTKALRRLAEGDELAATRLAARALGLRYDGDAGTAAGSLGAHLFLWDELRVELREDEDEPLDRAEAVLRSLQEPTRREWLSLVVGAADGDTSQRIGRRIDRLAEAEGYVEREAFEDIEPLERRVDIAMQLLRGILAVRRTD